MSDNGCESPICSEDSSFDLGFSQMNTPIQPEKYYPLNWFKNNDNIDCPEIKNYINNVLDKENKDSVLLLLLISN